MAESIQNITSQLAVATENWGARKQESPDRERRQPSQQAVQNPIRDALVISADAQRLLQNRDALAAKKETPRQPKANAGQNLVNPAPTELDEHAVAAQAATRSTNALEIHPNTQKVAATYRAMYKRDMPETALAPYGTGIYRRV